MGRTSRVAPESSDESKSGVTSNGKSSSNSQLAFENLDLSSAITGKVIETNLSTTNLRLTENDKPVKPKRKPRKRLARSVSEVVEEKEKRERNVISRFGDGEGEEGSAENSVTEKESAGGGDGDQPAAAADTPIAIGDNKHQYCDCCDGEGLRCGAKLHACGAQGCNPHYLYYCDLDKKKGVLYEECPQMCITDPNEGAEDFCSVLLDATFFWVKPKFYEMQTAARSFELKIPIKVQQQFKEFDVFDAIDKLNAEESSTKADAVEGAVTVEPAAEKGVVTEEVDNTLKEQAEEQTTETSTEADNTLKEQADQQTTETSTADSEPATEATEATEAILKAAEEETETPAPPTTEGGEAS